MHIGLDMGAPAGDQSVIVSTQISEGRFVTYQMKNITGWAARRVSILMRLMQRSVVVDRGYKTECYEWTGPTSGNGRGGQYGRMCLNDTTCAVHKVAWTNEHGYIPPKKQLDHLCENRKCWREDHLELVSHKRNQKRRAARRKAS